MVLKDFMLMTSQLLAGIQMKPNGAVSKQMMSFSNIAVITKQYNTVAFYLPGDERT